MGTDDARGRADAAPSSGIALIAVLWVLALLSVLAGAVVVSGRTDIALAGNLAEAARAQALADGAVRRAALILAEQASRRRGRRDEIDPAAGVALEPGDGGGGGDIALTIGDFVASDARWPLDESPVILEIGGAAIIVSVQDEGGLIDVGAAPESLVSSLIQAVGVEQDEADSLAAAVADYVDADDDVRPGGSEAFDYAAAGLPGPRNRPLQAVDELRAVLGMTHELYTLIEPVITVYTRQPGIDPAVAPPLALSAMRNQGLTEEAAAETDEQRPRALSGARRSRGRVLRIKAEAALASGAVFVREAVVKLGGRGAPYTVVRWRRGTIDDAD